MASIGQILDDLNSPPPNKQEEAADFIRRLKGDAERTVLQSLSDTAGSLAETEAGDLAQIIEAGCERVDAGEW